MFAPGRGTQLVLWRPETIRNPTETLVVSAIDPSLRRAGGTGRSTAESFLTEVNRLFRNRF